MIGSALAGAAIAHIAFVVLIIMAAVYERWRLVAICGVLWIAGYLAARQFAPFAPYFMPGVAILDIVLVFIVLQRDVRLM